MRAPRVPARPDLRRWVPGMTRRVRARCPRPSSKSEGARTSVPPMHLDVDDHRFRCAGRHGRDSVCRLRVYRDPDRPTVVVATELQGDQGTPIHEYAPYLMGVVAEAIEARLGTALWVEHVPAGGDRPELLAFVEFEWGRGLMPLVTRRTAVTRARVEALIGQPLED